MKKAMISIVAAVHAILGLIFLVAGGYLASLGGSPYYVVAGLLLLGFAFLLLKGSKWAMPIFGLLFVATVLWSLWEVGGSFWGLVPRLAWLLVLTIIVSALYPVLFAGGGRKVSAAIAVVLALVCVAGGVSMFNPHFVVADVVPDRNLQPSAPEPSSQWMAYGNSAHGTRFADLTQITPSNVQNLEVAWSFHTGDIVTGGAEDQNTPLYVDNTVFTCTPYNKVIALDAQTGAEKWRFDPEIYNGQRPGWRYRCRSLGFYKSAEQTGPLQVASAPAGQPAPHYTAATAGAVECRSRIAFATMDARLIELDPETGKLCSNFGTNGIVDLKVGMGDVGIADYLTTSGAVIAQDKIVLGGLVLDNQRVGEPSGVIRAFNVLTGELDWAWDVGNPATTKLPPEGQTYTRGTPNMWSVPTVDPALGLVYLPLGTPTPDFWGPDRRPFDEAYDSSLVALDIATGKERWKFQTVHHDLWDFDVPSLPLLYDVPTANGTVPAVISVTKSGQVYVLDRRTGTPVAAVKETPVPTTGGAPGEKLSPTQPLSVGMPAVGDEILTESKMWGATVFDQLYCRIQFKSHRYQGPFTPPGLTRSIQYPGDTGGFNWGTGAIDERTGMLYAPEMRLPEYVQLVPREQYQQAKASLAPGERIATQDGTPYAVRQSLMMSPLGIPCVEPPFGLMAAMDLVDKKMVWRRPMGTVEDATLPIGFGIPFPIPLGMPPSGGPLSTASGLIFYAGTQDYYLRALDAKSGKELWKGRMPFGSNAAPMSYMAADGKQYILVTAGGAPRATRDRGDLIVAYKLPN